MRVLLLILLVLLTLQLKAQSISKAAAIEDLDFLATAIQYGHASNYNPAQPVRITKALRSVAGLDQDSISAMEFRLFLGDALQEIGCIHTSVRYDPLNISPQQAAYFPFQLALDNIGKIFIAAPDSSRYLGEEILFINKVSAADLHRDLSRYVSGDGNSAAYPQAAGGLLSSALIPRLLGFPDTYHIETHIEHLNVAAVNQRIRKEVPEFPFPILQTGVAYKFGVSGKVALLKISAFRKKDRSGFRSVFNYLESRPAIAGLILDLRGNGGGSRKAAVTLTKGLINQPFQYQMLKPNLSSKQYVTRKGKLFISLAKYKYAFKNWFRTKSTEYGRSTVYRYRSGADSFSGKVIVLTDGFTASSSTMVTSWLAQFSQPVFIGQAAGGGYNGNNGGSFPEVELPNSRIRIRLPVYRLVLDPNSNSSGGLEVDHQIFIDGETLKSGRDEALEKAKELLGN